MNVERLEHLIEVLTKVEEEERPFDMKVWTQTKRGLFSGDAKAVPLLNRPRWRCGTASCALGWATRDPEFRAQGLVFYDRDNPQPVYEGYRGFEAGAKFFELTLEQAKLLFEPNRYPSKEITAHDVIMRIRGLIRDAKTEEAHA